MKSRYLAALGEIEDMLSFVTQASRDNQLAEELGITTKQAAYMAQALEEAVDALETGVEDANLVPIQE